MKKTIALILCLCLVLGLLSGCGQPSEVPAQETAAPTAAPTPAPTPEPTPEPLDAAKLYDTAAEELAGAGSLAFSYTITQKITLPDYASEELGERVMEEKTARSASYENLGGEDFRAELSDTVTLSLTKKLTQHQVYADGALYLELEGGKYAVKTKAEDFMDSQLPLTLLDPSHFESAAAEQTAEGFALRFEQATEAEPWAMPEEAELLEAAGEATLTAAGALSSESYEIRYRFGGLTMSVRWEAACERPESLDLSGSVPQNAKKYESLDSAEAPLMLAKALWMLETADVVQASATTDYYSAAAGQAIRTYTQENLISRENDPLVHEEISVNATNYATRKGSSYSYESDYARCKMTITASNGETDSFLTDAVTVESAVRKILTRYFPKAGDLVDAEIKEVGDYWLISFAGNESFGLQVKDGVCEEVFNTDPKVLDNLASAYRTKTAEGFVAVEKVSGIPTALNVSFEGLHTVESSPYELTMAMNLGLSLFTNKACAEIYEEPLAGPEPENKPTPVFYEVTDGEGHKMYLFGTIHVGDDRTAYLPQVIYDALEEADALAVEFDDDRFSDSIEGNDELRKVLMEAYYYTDGTVIGNHIDSELYKEALDYLKVSGEYTDTAENMKPFLWSNAIELFYLAQGRSLSSDKGVDNRLMTLARAAEKEILDVESGEFQISMMGNYTDPVQETLLAGTVEYSRADYINSTLRLFEAWCEGDEAALIERLAAMDEEERAEYDEDDLAIYDEYHQKMEVERNANMFEVAKGYLAEGKTVFFAVGLAHLLGEGGLVQALRDAGYTVTLIDTHSN